VVARDHGDMDVEELQFGDVRLVRIVDGIVDSPAQDPVPAWCVPDFAPSVDTVRLSFAAYAVEVDDRRLVVDPWLVADGARDLPDADVHAEQLADALRSTGFDPDTIDTVVLSHLDGIGWSIRPGDDGPVPMFPNARYLLGRSGVAAWSDGTLAGSEGFRFLLDAGVVDEVDLDAQLSDRIRLHPSEGHTIGHVAVRIDTRPGELVLAGHLFLFPSQVADPSIVQDVDPEQAADERRRLLAELAATDGVLFAQLLGGRGGGTVVASDDGSHALRALTPVPPPSR
jgi:glyoxylase-like metal-dependent hydrolase (beta-lactamase superfamily II)